MSQLAATESLMRCGKEVDEQLLNDCGSERQATELLQLNWNAVPVANHPWFPVQNAP
jgi:hypothetical protein